jgi:hypothetical protein
MYPTSRTKLASPTTSTCKPPTNHQRPHHTMAQLTAVAYRLGAPTRLPKQRVRDRTTAPYSSEMAPDRRHCLPRPYMCNGVGITLKLLDAIWPAGRRPIRMCVSPAGEVSRASYRRVRPTGRVQLHAPGASSLQRIHIKRVQR